MLGWLWGRGAGSASTSPTDELLAKLTAEGSPNPPQRFGSPIHHDYSVAM